MITTWKELERKIDDCSVEVKWEDFETRIYTMAQLITDDVKSIADLGAGKMKLKTLLKQDVKYYPVDYCKRCNETIICDFEKKEFPNVAVDAYMISGCLEYVSDWQWFAKKVCDMSPKYIYLSYNVKGSVEQRPTWWCNDLSYEQLLNCFAQYGYVATRRVFWHTTPIFKFEKGSSTYISEFCNMCETCYDCKFGYPVKELMVANNILLFQAEKYKKEVSEDLLYSINICKNIYDKIGWIPNNAVCQCETCNDCANKCSKKINIKQNILDLFRRFKKYYWTKEAHIARIKELTQDKKYNKIGLYPNGGFSKLIIDLHNENIGEPDFEWLLFNSDPKTWGSELDGRVIHGPDEIPDIKPDKIIICTYKFDEDIYADLKKYEEYGIKIVKLHRPEEMPWVF